MAFILRKYTTELYYVYIYIYILRQIYYGRCIMADRRTADKLRQTDYGRQTMKILRQTYYGRYFMADISCTTEMIICWQISSASNSRLLCSNLLVSTHRPKDSSGLLYAVSVANRTLFDRPQGHQAPNPWISVTCPWRLPQA